VVGTVIVPGRSRTGFAGMYPILYAFFGPDGRLDRAAMRRQVEACIAQGVDGIALLGLVTEVHKMDTAERRAVVEVVCEAVAGRVPVAVTVGETTPGGQRDFVRFAEDCGAAWVILQPAPVKGLSEAEHVRFLGSVAEAARVPVAIQNNPVNLDVSLSNAALIQLNRAHPNVSLLKGEGAAIQVQRLIEEAAGAFDVFCGHAGKELPTNLRAGCVGVIPAPDLVDVQTRIMRLFGQATPEATAEALRLHAACLPWITFVISSVPILLAYGKRLMAQRLGLPDPAGRFLDLATTPFGRDEADRLARDLGLGALPT
jgi:2-keto-3-deoxy-L-arabinonate dehydratase